MKWDWQYVLQILPALARGALITAEATLFATVLAMLLGLFFALVHRTRPAVSRPTRWFTDFVRGTPLLVQLYFLFFVLPDLGLTLSPLLAGVIGFGVHYSTYTAEVYRAGIENIPLGQWEAAKALNLSAADKWRYTILPQAVPPMIPALANYLISMFKETPLLSAITVVELMNSARTAANFSYRYLEPVTMVGVFFLIISIPSAI